ncbi:glutamate 5-kinase [Candidatus Woesearchaeota archaeon]|nr:glutamate 5-kinase [Candidatus Woesearchaeota archaeon]
MEQNKKKPQRIVIKIGTNLLTNNLIGLKGEFIQKIASEVAELRKGGHEVIIVTSGAIGAGSLELGIKKNREVEVRQALAAVGQGSVMGAYHDAFSRHNIHVAQLLITYEDFSDRVRYLNLRNCLLKLLDWGVIPIINENDPVSTKEIGSSFGDNDRLSALVACKIDADILVILTDIDGLYDNNPKTHKDATLIRNVSVISKDIERAAGKSGSELAIGGMSAKVQAAKIVMEAGILMVIANGMKKEIIRNVLSGQEGTSFSPEKKISNKDRWIRFAAPKGRIAINRCAEDVLKQGKSSLLAVGIDRIEGKFEKNDVVEIDDIAKGIVDYSSEDLEKLKGQKGKVAVKKENLVVL